MTIESESFVRRVINAEGAKDLAKKAYQERLHDVSEKLIKAIDRIDKYVESATKERRRSTVILSVQKWDIKVRDIKKTEGYKAFESAVKDRHMRASIGKHWSDFPGWNTLRPALWFIVHW